MFQRSFSVYSMICRKCLSAFVGAAFLATSIISPAYAQAVFNLPQPGAMVGLSEMFAPVVLKGVTIHPEDPLLFDFIVDNGQSALKGQALTDETTKLVKYFLAGLAVPEKDLWVNLSPKEQDRVMADELSHTDVGRDMLAQDYILKQVTASLMYPEKDLGRKFWDEVYKRSYEQFGSTDVPVDTFNKVWIMPSQATVYQNGNNAFVAGAALKVMLESDYAAAKGMNAAASTDVIEMSKDVVRSVILPVLEKEVNEGRNFASLRQVFSSMILAGWYKSALKESLLAKVYSNTNKVGGIEIAEKDAREKVYAQYLQAYQKGVYNYVKEEFDQSTQQTTPRKYFSGGVTWDKAMTPEVIKDASQVVVAGAVNTVTYKMNALTTDAAESFRIKKNILRSIVEGDKTSRAVKFGTSGDRGLFDVDFTPDHKNRIANGIALYAGKEYPGKIMYVGYDPRRDNKAAVKDAARILAAHGLKVRIIAEESTPVPVLAYLTRSDKNAAGFVAYTASHSPYTDGGIKYSPPHGGAAPSKVTDLITAYANGTDESLMAEDYREAIEAGAIEELSPEQAVGMYVNEYIIPKLKSLGAWQSIVDHIKANPDFRLVLDPMQGSAVRYFQSLYGALAKDAGRDFFTIINADNSDPTFSQVNKEPNPTKEKSRAGLISKVKEGAGRWMGSSADADSDRFGNIDLNGDFMSANDMIAMIAYFLNKEIGVKGRIGKTVATSNFVNAIARHLGLEVDEFAVGFKNIVASALEGREYVVGGEESSHVMVGPFQDSWDDGIVVGVMGLWMLAKTGKSLTEYKKEIQKALGQKFLIETLTIRGADDSIKRPVLDIIARTKEELASGKTREDLTVVRDIERITGETVQDLITKDGVKLVLPSGWILLRPSGTEPAIKFYVEVASPFTADDDQMKAQFDNLVKSGKILMFGDADHAMSVDDGSAIDDDAAAPDVTGMIRYQGAPLPAEILKREVDRIKAAFDFEKNLPDTSWRAMTWTVLFSGNKKEVDLVQADISAVVNDLSRHAPLLMKSRPRWTPEGKIFFEIVLGIRHNLPKETVPARRLPFAERKKQELKEQKRREYDVASVQVTVDTWVRNTERMLNAAAAPAVEEKAPEQVAQTIAYKDLEAPRQDWVAAERIVQEAFDRVISQESKRPEDVLPDLSDVFLARVNQKSPLEVQRSFGKIVELLVRGLGETTLRSKVYVDDHANTETAFVLRIKHINKTSHKKNLEDIKSKQKMASQWFQDRLKQPVATAEETADPAEKMVTIKGVTASVSDWLAAVWVIDNQFINKLDKLLTHTNQVGFDHRVERLKVVAPLKRIQTRLAQWPIRVHFGPVDQGTPRGRAFVNIVDALAAELGVSAEPIVIHDDSDDFVASYMVTILPVSARSGVMNFVDISAKVDKWCDDIRAQVTGLSSDKAEITINGVTMSDRQWLEAAATLEDVLKEGDIKKDFWPGSDIAIDLFKVREGRTSAEQDRVLAVARILAPEINASVAEVREGDYAPTLVAWQLHIRHDQRVYAIDRWSEWPDRKERALNRLDEIKASVIDRSRATAAEEGSFYQAPVTHESVTLFEEDWNGVIAALERAFAKEPAWSNAGGVIVEVVNIDERGTFALKDKIIRVARAMAADMKKTVVQVREDGRMAQLYAEPDLFKYGLDPLKQWPDRQAEAMAWLEGAKAAVAAARNETLSEEPAYLRAQKDAAEFVKGGIDLGTGNYLTVIARDAAGMPQFDPAQLKALQHDLRGIVPVAVGAPVPADLQLLLGK